MPALELMASPFGGPATNPEPGVIGDVAFAGVQLAERRNMRWVLATMPRTGGFWRAMVDAEQRVAEAMRKVDLGQAGDPIAALRVRLAPLYDSVLSQELNDVLCAAAERKAGEPAPVLRLHLQPGMDTVPWELLFKRDFLGLEFQVARLPIVSGGPNRAGRVRRVTRISSLLGAQVVDDSQRQAWDQTFDGTINGSVTLWKSPPETTTDWPTVGVFPDAFGEILVFTCHGLSSATGERYWSFDKNRPEDMDTSVYLKDGENQFQLSGRAPLVFANACSSAGIADAAPGVPRFTALAEGFGVRWYDLGASVFVGTIGPVSKKVALEFAKRFFQRLLGDGLPVGEALWSTKRSFAEDGEKDPSWLFYCLYGDPESRFVAGTGHG
jgi:hypothetical protein